MKTFTATSVLVAMCQASLTSVKDPLAHGVENEAVANMALLVGRDGYKVIRHGDLKK